VKYFLQYYGQFSKLWFFSGDYCEGFSSLKATKRIQSDRHRCTGMNYRIVTKTKTGKVARVMKKPLTPVE